MLNRKIEEVISLEELLSQYKSNRGIIKSLEEKNDYIKKQILHHYMQDMDDLKDNEGRSLVTYKSSIRMSFQSKLFEKDHKDLYNQYLDVIEVKTFLVK